MPEWNTNLNLPLTNRTYTLDEIIKPDEHIKPDTIDGKEIFLISSDTMNYSFGIGEYLKNRLDQGFSDIELVLQNGEASVEVALADGVELDSAYFSRGELNIDIINTGPSLIEFEVTFPDLFKSDGKSFKIRSSVPGNGRSSSILDLSGCTYSSYLLVDKSKLRINGKVISGGGTGLVKLNVSIRNSDFKYISGKLPTMDISRIQEPFELPINDAIQKFRDKFILDNTVLSIEAEYKTDLKNPFEIQVKNIQVYGMRNDGLTKFLEDKSGNNNLGVMTITKNKIIKTFSNGNSNIAEFLSYLPDSVYLKADVTINPQNKRGEASSSDSVLLDFKFIISGEMAFNNIPYTDSVSIQFSSDNKKAIRNGREAALFLEITNAIPMAVDFDIAFADSLGNVLFNKKLFVEASEVDASGKTSVPTESYSQITLDSTEIQKFSNSEKVVYNLLLSTSGIGKKVTIQPGNWIKLLTYFKLKYHIKFE